MRVVGARKNGKDFSAGGGRFPAGVADLSGAPGRRRLRLADFLMSAELPLPKSVFCHGFVLDSVGAKMSKTLGNG